MSELELTSPISSAPSIAQNDQSAPSGPVFRIAFTGGPCGGKTTALAEMSERLRSRGVKAFVVPEAATLFFTGGAGTLDLSCEEQSRTFQTGLLRTQIALEDSFLALAHAAGGRAVVLCDRGALDGSVYVSPDIWSQMLKDSGHDEAELRDGRYDLVIHLVSVCFHSIHFCMSASPG